MGFISANTLWYSLLYNIVYLYSGAFLCLFTVRERLRKSWLFIAMAVIITSVPYVLIARYFYYFTIVYAALAFVFCLWVADVPRSKMLFIFLLAANYLYLASAVVRQVGDGNQHLLTLLTVPLVAWWMRRSIWPLVRDMEPPELKMMFPLAVVLFAAAMFVCSDYFLLRMGIPVRWRMLIVFIFAGITFAAYMVMLRMLRSVVQNARLREEMHLAEMRVAAENAALDRLNLMKSDLLATISHETRTPLAVLSGYADVISMEMRHKGVDEQTSHDLDRIAAEAQRLANIMDEMQRLSKARDADTHRAPTSLPETVLSATRLYTPILARQDTRLETHVEENLPDVYANAGELTQVLFNLLANAKNHTAGGDLVAIHAELEEPGMVVVTVSDTGAGIAPELLPHVFERGVCQSEEGGSGLGLAICKDIVESHGGRITIESEAGKGTAVRFTLPVYVQGEEGGRHGHDHSVG